MSHSNGSKKASKYTNFQPQDYSNIRKKKFKFQHQETRKGNKTDTKIPKVWKKKNPLCEFFFFLTKSIYDTNNCISSNINSI